jgi:hypothetical protein
MGQDFQFLCKTYGIRIFCPCPKQIGSEYSTPASNRWVRIFNPCLKQIGELGYSIQLETGKWARTFNS